VKRSRPVLLVVPSLQEAWDNAIAPWFDQVLPGTWQRQLPALVVVPTRGQANNLKARLIAKGFSHLGLRFVTPSSLRALLALDDATPAAEPEHLRLLLAIAASEMEDWPNESEALAAKAVARAPALLLRALDRLETAGWKFEELRLPSFAPVVQRFNELLKKCDFVLPGETDRRRLQQAARGRREFSHVLITGFDGAHWAEWFLLRAALELAENATIVLEEPRENFYDFDLCWIGSWKEVSGVARPSGRIAQNQPASFRKNPARKLQRGVAGRSRTAARILRHARGRQISVGRRSSAGAAVSPTARHARAVSRTDSRRAFPSRLEATRARTCQRRA